MEDFFINKKRMLKKEKEQMDKHQFFTWMKEAFIASGCTIVKQNQTCATVQLTEDVDAVLMNRPFYWEYVKRLNQVGEPFTFSFTTDFNHSSKEVEYVHPTSFRFERFKRYMKNKAMFIQLYEQQQTPSSLHPWLNINFKIQYRTNVMKEETYSCGLHLISGKIIESFLEETESLHFSSSIAPYHFTLTPLIKWNYGILRIEHFILQYLEQKEHHWIHEAKMRLQDELSLLYRFYDENDPLCKQEEKAIKERLFPHIQLSFISMGLFYLSPLTTNQLITKKAPFKV